MNRRVLAGFVAGLVAIAAAAIPAAGLADQGGHPHSKKACKVHRHYGRHHGKAKGRNFDHGKKCGIPHTGQTGQTGTTGTTGQTGETGTTGSTGSHSVKHDPTRTRKHFRRRVRTHHKAQTRTRTHFENGTTKHGSGSAKHS